MDTLMGVHMMFVILGMASAANEAVMRDSAYTNLFTAKQNPNQGCGSWLLEFDQSNADLVKARNGKVIDPDFLLEWMLHKTEKECVDVLKKQNALILNIIIDIKIKLKIKVDVDM